MSALAAVYVLTCILGIIQVINPMIFIKLKVQGAGSLKSVRVGGYFTIFISILIFLYDLYK